MGEVVPANFNKGSRETTDQTLQDGDLLSFAVAVDGRYDSLALIDPDSAAEANAQTAKWLIELSQRQE